MVHTNTNHVRVWISSPDRTFALIDLAPSNAPSLALATLQASDVEATDTPEEPTHWNDPDALESLNFNLSALKA